MTGRILCGYPMGDSVTCRNTAPCPVHRDALLEVIVDQYRDRDLAAAADIPASNPAPGLFQQVTGKPLPQYPHGPCSCSALVGGVPVKVNPACPQHGQRTDYRELLVDDAHDWSVRHRLEATLGRKALATRLADALTPQLGAELADRLDTIVTQARTEAVVALENKISEGLKAARERLTAEAEAKRREVHDERYRGNSRLS